MLGQRSCSFDRCRMAVLAGAGDNGGVSFD